MTDPEDRHAGTAPKPMAPDTTGDDGATLAGYRVLLWAVVYKRLLLLRRYPVNTAAQIVTVYLFFLVIFVGGQAVADSVGGGPGAVGETLDGLIVGWFLWTMSLTAYFSLAQNVTQESQWGTLEQLYMSPYGFGTVMVVMVVSNVLESLVWGAIVLALMLATTGRSLALDLFTIVPISLFAIASVVGIGFVFAGLALVYKRIENVSQLVQFALIGLIAAPLADVAALRFLPLAQGSAMLQAAMQDGVGLLSFTPGNLAVLVGTGVAYFVAGYLVFRYCARVARRRGVMGHY